MTTDYLEEPSTEEHFDNATFLRRTRTRRNNRSARRNAIIDLPFIPIAEPALIPTPPRNPPVIHGNSNIEPPIGISINRYLRLNSEPDYNVLSRFINTIITSEIGIGCSSLAMFICINYSNIGRLQDFNDWENIVQYILHNYGGNIDTQSLRNIVYRVWTGYTEENEILNN